MGNICRSPTAEGVFRHRVRNAGLADRIETDSAGTHGYHIGKGPDQRSQAEARNRGIDLSDIRSRRVKASDFSYFDWILAMDRENLSILESESPDAERHKLHLFLKFAPDLPEEEVPDPYYGGERGFVHVFDLIDAAAEGLLDTIRRQHGLR
ncbi:low molecular weight phosphotyrosine protein phosphatase [Methylonatrum kenyense]|uniref:low molecular weight protein-tyrosine-phosphatase n=1 Tax=Methylonatrum kenyense TaxID=455253 RepID=UPI0020BFCC7C|nr:low molecular weight protein-tyrosine-phosphatase [Methylonatrum kenyense]MCK8516485.1 low molecular weight phosphotyrosine protein phosphatase [Methylonatrum kenyense]